MSVVHALRNTVLTMNAIEENVSTLLQNVEIVLDKHVEYTKEAETVQDAYVVARDCFDALVKNILDYAEAEKNLIYSSREECKAKLTAVLEKYE